MSDRFHPGRTPTMRRRVIRRYCTEYQLVLFGEEEFERPRALVDPLMFERDWDTQNTLRELLATEFGRDVHRMNDHEILAALADLVAHDAIRLVEVERPAPSPGGVTKDREEESDLGKQPAPTTTWIEVQLLDEAEEPVSGVQYQIVRVGGAVRSGELDRYGLSWLRERSPLTPSAAKASASLTSRAMSAGSRPPMRIWFQ